MTCRLDPSDSVHVRPVVVAVFWLDGGGVKRHPHTQGANDRGPRGAGNPSLRLYGCSSRRHRGSERREDAVTGVLDDPASVVLHRRRHNSVVDHECVVHLLWECVP